VRGTSDWNAIGSSLVVIAAILFAGCGDLTEDGQNPSLRNFPHRTERQAIKGGEVDTEHTAVVGMAVERDRGFGVCTGTLIAKNLVLTAQHCVSELSGGRGIDCDSTTFTSRLEPGDIRVATETRLRGNSDFYRVETIVTPEGDGVCGKDIALLRLRQTVDSGEAVPRVPQLETEVTEGDVFTAMGYGTTGENESGRAGTRRRLEGRRVRCVGASCYGRYVQDGEFVGSGGTCQGDSGGGAYGSDEKVFGVLSRGGGDCDTALYTGVPTWSELIRKTAYEAARDAGYSLPEWATTGHDEDDDGIGSDFDNCPDTANFEQVDSDDDGDGVPDDEDNCSKTPNPGQKDLDGDGEGDACVDDRDGDNVDDRADTCPNLVNPEQRTSGDDGECRDPDGDGIAAVADNCPETTNPEQQDEDGDGVGAKCDDDEEFVDPNSGNGPTPVPTPVDETESRSACSSAGADLPSRALGFGLFAVVVFAGRTFRRRE
jgi:hypothetical protein